MNQLRFKFLLSTSLFTTLVVLSVSVKCAEVYPGLPTRIQNPLLQSYFIPANPITSEQPWALSHALYITNTYQQEQRQQDFVIIDVENMRYDLQITHRRDDWLYNLNLSLISNQAGGLDQTIEKWHDIFGLPQSGRDTVSHDLIQLYYQEQDTLYLNSQSSSEGLGDIQLALGYQLDHSSQLWLALELPSNDSSLLISNQGIDAAIWYSGSRQVSDFRHVYGTLGLALPSDSGLLENHLRPQVLFAQLGMQQALTANYQLILQVDLNSAIADSTLDAMGDALQVQFGLRLLNILDAHQIDLFFSEDVVPGFAPDITFALRLSPRPN